MPKIVKNGQLFDLEFNNFIRVELQKPILEEDWIFRTQIVAVTEMCWTDTCNCGQVLLP